MKPPSEFFQLLDPPADFDARPAIETLLNWAGENRASDLHLRPDGGSVEILQRVDGVLARCCELDSAVYERLLVGIKNMARLASYKKSIPQDGHIKLSGLEVRVATAPTYTGEKVVFRLAHRDRDLPDLGALGLTSETEERIRRLVERPEGLILATGPSGSGKTTTLLAVMRWLYAKHLKEHRARLNVVTLEDPVECVIPEFSQTEIRKAQGYDFADGLRSLLRQDPDLLFVGEIRDRETASAVIQTGLTGHLVFSSVHARDSVGVIPRMLELGAEPYQLAAGLAGVVYQRLLRKLCQECRREAAPDPDLESERKSLGLEEAPHWTAPGCNQCDGTGYRGRQAVAEVLKVDEGLTQLILDKAPLEELRLRAASAGTVPLRLEGLARVAEGRTSYQEVCRLIPC